MDADLKDRAFQYLEQIKQNPAASLFCAQNFFDDNYSVDSIRFVCLQVCFNSIYVKVNDNKSCSLQTFEVSLTNSYGNYDPVQREGIRGMLIKWLRANATKVEPSYIRNKIAQIFVLVFQYEFPTNWPTFFSDAIQLFEVSVVVFIPTISAIWYVK